MGYMAEIKILACELEDNYACPPMYRYTVQDESGGVLTAYHRYSTEPELILSIARSQRSASETANALAGGATDPQRFN